MKTLNERLSESIKHATNDFDNTSLDKNILMEITDKLIDYVIEVERKETREDNASKSLENDLYKIFN